MEYGPGTSVIPESLYGSILKRWGDLIVSLLLLLLVFPLLLWIAGSIRLESKGPIFFVQKRSGRHGKVFSLFKFRTMIHKDRIAEHEVFGKNDDVTGVGYWLRRFKLDELPQLFNVLIGDMSLVGPRPGLTDRGDLQNPDYVLRLTVRPGMTGLAQVNGNIFMSWTDRWRFDAQYVRRLSFWLDLGIVAKTIAVVMFGEHHFLRKSEEDDKSTVTREPDPNGMPGGQRSERDKTNAQSHNT